jgi:type IV secretion system protein VirB10
MTDATANPQKVEPETLELRARPRPVTRFRRRIVIGIAAASAAAIIAAALLALRPSSSAKGPGGELYNVDRKPTAEGLAALPSRYDKVKAPPLGPPLPGDLGPAELRARKTLGVPTSGPASENDAARAEELRQAQLVHHANESAVFFQSAAKGGSAPQDTAANSGGGPVPASASADNQLALDPLRDQNAQQRKLDFINARDDRNTYNPHALQDPVSPYEVMAGALLSASLITGLDSDLPGLVVAQITQNVFDTVTGQTLLIPQGSRLVGTYDSVVAFGQSRALVVWQRIIMPDGSSIQIDNLPATDTNGYAGLKDQVDYHTWALLKGVGLSTLLGVGSELTLTGRSDLVSAIRLSTEDSLNQVGQQLTQKNLNLQPTIKVRPGWPLRVIVHKDLILRPYRG